MKLIPLSQKFKCKNESNKYFTMVDNEDYDLLIKTNWHIHKSGGNFYAKNDCNQIHRVVMGCKKNDGLFIDHKDGNGLNNQKENLRFCTKQQNSRNSKKRNSCTSKYRGVYYIKNENKWGCHIAYNNKRKWLGLFVCEKDAAIRYNNEAVLFFGEFARLNII